MPVYQSIAIIIGAAVAVISAFAAILGLPKLITEASNRGRIARKIEHLDRLIAFTDDKHAKSRYLRQRRDFASDLAEADAIRLTATSQFLVWSPTVVIVLMYVGFAALLVVNPVNRRGSTVRDSFSPSYMWSRYAESPAPAVASVVILVAAALFSWIFTSSRPARLRRLKANRYLYRRLGYPKHFVRLPEPGLWSTFRHLGRDLDPSQILDKLLVEIEKTWPHANHSPSRSHHIKRMASVRLQLSYNAYAKNLAEEHGKKAWLKR